jgi:hypothetical protein
MGDLSGRSSPPQPNVPFIRVISVSGIVVFPHHLFSVVSGTLWFSFLNIATIIQHVSERTGRGFKAACNSAFHLHCFWAKLPCLISPRPYISELHQWQPLKTPGAFIYGIGGVSPRGGL